jgi:hypothetical protein
LDERHVQAQEMFEFNARVMSVKDFKLQEHFWTKTSVIIFGYVRRFCCEIIGTISII